MNLERMNGLTTKKQSVRTVTCDSVHLGVPGQTDGNQGMCSVSWRVWYQQLQLLVDLVVLALHHVGVVEVGYAPLKVDLPLFTDGFQNLIFELSANFKQAGSPATLTHLNNASATVVAFLFLKGSNMRNLLYKSSTDNIQTWSLSGVILPIRTLLLI